MDYSKSISNAIAMLIKGEYETPIIVDNNDKKNGRILRELESLRISILSAKSDVIGEIDKQRVEVASVAHDLKTPLAIISGYAECLQDGMKDKDYLGLLSSKIAEMNKQVIALVDSTRNDIEQDKECNFESIIASEYLAVEMEKFRPLAKFNDIEYIVGSIPSVKIFARRDSLEKVLQNLISNAIKYSLEDHKVVVKFRRYAHYLRINVKDSGIGISKEDLKHIFDKFYVANNANTKSSKSGLGLYITKQSIEEMGGHISVKSTLGKGSVFSVFIPIDERSKYIGVRTETIDNMEKKNKFFLWLFFGWFMTSFYRFLKYSETRQRYTLICGFLFTIFYPIGWMVDIIEIMVSNRITYLIY